MLSSGGGSSVTAYANLAAFSSSGNTVGDFAFANDTKALYVWDGSEWDRVWSDGQEGGPTFTTPPNSNYELNSGGNLDVTVIATDPDGFPVEYSVITNPTNPSQLTGAISQTSTGVFRFPGSDNSAHVGSFTTKFIADDGVQKSTVTSTFGLTVMAQQSNITRWYDFGDSDTYSGSGTSVYDTSGSNAITLENTDGSYSSPNYTFAIGQHMTIGSELSTAKTVMFIWKKGATGIPLLLNSGGGNYHGVYENTGSNDFDTGFSVWSGESRITRVNGIIQDGNRQTAWDSLDTSKFNSHIATGINFGSSLKFNGYGGFQTALQLRAIIGWSVVLTAAEAESMHNYYRTLIGTSNMTAWSS